MMIIDDKKTFDKQIIANFFCVFHHNGKQAPGPGNFTTKSNMEKL